MWCENQVDLFRLATFVMADHNPHPQSDGVYLVGNTPANETSILEAGRDLYRAGRAKNIVLCGGGPYVPPESKTIAYSGGDAWKRWLLLNDIPAEAVLFMDTPRPAPSHTGTDVVRFVNFAKARGWKIVTLVACPPHMLRTFAIAAGVVLREYPELLVYAHPGRSLPWNEHGLFSQGIGGNRLDDFIDGEYERLNRVYNNIYDVASATEVLDYIRRRDAAAKKMLGQ